MAYHHLIKTLCCLTFAADHGANAAAPNAIAKEETGHSMNLQNLLQEYIDDSGKRGRA